MNASPTARHRRSPFPAEIAYILPMGLFLLGIAITSQWPGTFAPIYVIKTITVAAALTVCWPAYERIDWSGWPLGVVFGVIGIVEWIGVEKLLLHAWPDYPRAGGDVFDPTVAIASVGWRYAFIAIRWAGAALVVPVMEELFWRDYLWRTVIAPNDFRLARVGEWDAMAFCVVAVFFASVHIQWITAIGWALLIGWLLLRTKSLGACIVMHGVTNLLLGAYVLWRHDWYFW